MPHWIRPPAPAIFPGANADARPESRPPQGAAQVQELQDWAEVQHRLCIARYWIGLRGVYPKITRTVIRDCQKRCELLADEIETALAPPPPPVPGPEAPPPREVLAAVPEIDFAKLDAEVAEERPSWRDGWRTLKLSLATLFRRRGEVNRD